MPECGQDRASGRWKNLNNLLLAKTMPPPLRCCCSVTCPLHHKAVIHSPCKINILWQRIDNISFHFRELWNIIQVPIHNFVATHPHLWRFISSTVCVKPKAPLESHACYCTFVQRYDEHPTFSNSCCLSLLVGPHSRFFEAKFVL